MVGLLLWKDGRTKRLERAVTVREQSVLQMRVPCAEILKTERTPEAVLRRRVTAAAKQLRKLGVSRVVLPRGFAAFQELEETGLRPISTLPLRRALAADWVAWLLREQAATGLCVAVSAAHLTGEVARTVTELALRYRYILLDLPYGGEELCRRLRREYGISLLMDSAGEQLERAEVRVLFAPRENCRNTVVLHLYEEREPLPPLALSPGVEAQLPAGADPGQLISLLWEAGAIRQGELAVGGTNLTKKADFLADSPP